MNFYSKKFLFICLMVMCFIIVFFVGKNNENNKPHFKEVEVNDISNKFERINYIGKNEKIRKVVLKNAGDQAYYGGKLYFVIEEDVIENDFFQKAGIYYFDIEAKKTSLIFEFASGVRVNELAVNQDSLFFRKYMDGKWSTCRYIFNKNKEILFENKTGSNTTSLPTLSSSNDHIAWFEAREESENTNVSIVTFNLNNNEIKTLNNNVYIENPYVRANIREDVLSYLIINNKNYTLTDILNNPNKTKGLLEIEVFDLKEQNRIIIPLPEIKSEIIGSVISNRQFSVLYSWQKKEVYIFNHVEKKWKYLNLKNDIFSLDLYKHLLIITDNKTGGIFSYNLKNFQVMRLTSDLPNQSYFLSKVTLDGKLISRFNGLNATSIIIDLEEIL